GNRRVCLGAAATARRICSMAAVRKHFEIGCALRPCCRRCDRHGGSRPANSDYRTRTATLHPQRRCMKERRTTMSARTFLIATTIAAGVILASSVPTLAQGAGAPGYGWGWGYGGCPGATGPGMMMGQGMGPGMMG